SGTIGRTGVPSAARRAGVRRRGVLVDEDLRETIETWSPPPGTVPSDAGWFPPVFAEAPFGIAVVDLSGHFVRVNQARAELHGRTIDEMEGSYALEGEDQADTAAYERNLVLGRARE